MTTDETRKLLAIIQSSYPRFADGRDPEITLKTWEYSLRDLPWDQVQAAAFLYIAQDVKGFPPMPGNIRELAQVRKTSGALGELEAWALVSKALSNGLYGSRAEFDKLPPEIQATLGSHETLRDWAMMEESEVQTVIASNFQRAYRARGESIRREGLLPAHIVGKLPERETPLLAEPESAEDQVEPEETEEQEGIPESIRDIMGRLREKFGGGGSCCSPFARTAES